VSIHKVNNKIKVFIKKHKLHPFVDVLIFAVIIYGFHELWWGNIKFLKSFLLFNETAQFLAEQVFIASSWIVENIIGYDITTKATTMYFPDNGYIDVNTSCSGLKQFYQWTVLILLFPGPWKHKLWYIPAGIIVIHLINIFRIVALSIILMLNPDIWDFCHMWILRPFFYVVIFIMWVIWVEKLKNKRKTKRITPLQRTGYQQVR
jgi:exosortase/archaeosortase family protein